MALAVEATNMALAVEATQCVVCPPELSIIARKGIINWVEATQCDGACGRGHTVCCLSAGIVDHCEKGHNQLLHIKMALAVEATQCVVCPPELSIIARKGIINLWTNSACRARPLVLSCA
eukprot:scaffold2241_cov59-Skeletonema_menzelii.AAC.1